MSNKKTSTAALDSFRMALSATGAAFRATRPAKKSERSRYGNNKPEIGNRKFGKPSLRFTRRTS
jgi:hypothetical protein